MKLNGAEIRNFKNITQTIPTNNDFKQYECVKVPHYQRPYKWGDINGDGEKGKLIKTLINDWHQQRNISDAHNLGYFAGSLVTVATNDNSKSKPHELIDGQQRFTTVYLANYIRFLLLRQIGREFLITKDFYDVPSLLNELKGIMKYVLFKDQPAKDQEFSNVHEQIRHASKAEKNYRAKLFEDAKESYYALVGLPNLHLDHNDYNKEYQKGIEQLITTASNLYLKYDRESFNRQLKDSLSLFRISFSHDLEPRAKRLDSLKCNEISTNFLNAMEVIFNEFKNLAHEANITPLEHAKKIDTKLKEFINEVKFCVIQTGNPNDAYTLFEVLNDRALALDDLDLIKNQFYKKFCLSNKTLNDENISSEIEKRENQWGDVIFSGTGNNKKKLIAFLSTIYLTSSRNIKYQTKSRYRNEIENRLNRQTSYSNNSLEYDFNVFETSKIFIQTFGIRFKSQDRKAIEAEYSQDRSIVYKLVHLLIALGYFGVLSGLVNLIFNYIKIKETSNFETDKVLCCFNKIANKSMHKDPELKFLFSQSVSLWQAVMLSEDYKLPLSIANNLIKKNHADSTTIETSSISFSVETIKSFETWANNWKYSPKSLKIRLLFARSLSIPTRIEINNFDYSERLNLKPFSMKIDSISDVGKIHLDHMEPKEIVPSNPNNYFQHLERDSYIHSLGNMLPLIADININKSNQPFVEVFNAIKKSGIEDSFIAKITESIFSQNHNKLNVPNQLFFTNRKKHLIGFFKESIINTKLFK